MCVLGHFPENVTTQKADDYVWPSALIIDKYHVIMVIIINFYGA